MKPVIALVGRPNVGKSTLFNRLTASRDALVVDLPGLTRDRQYGTGWHDGREFLVIDTGGIHSKPEGIDREVAAQARVAIAEADCVLFLVDARDGLTPEDASVHQQLREGGGRCLVVVNKVDGLDPEQAKAEFHTLGAKAVFAIAASQGSGVRRLIGHALDEFSPPAEAVAESEASTGIRITFAGRPNVGKSTLVNRLLGEERMLVRDEPGTTRDSIEIPFTRAGRDYVLIDTAGIRRRGKTREVVEKFSVIQSLRAIAEADVVVFLADAGEGVVEQDLHLLGHIVEAGKSLVIAFNKC
ncbi:MAG: ribosome biogenesis GTPase Der, partial [Gammaproteobacteria bacterium]|nr:ribosome biogenesis GTPase Der [Gammaproteobacteria bacterium]